MIIRWLGKCCFLLQDSLGRRILTDPFDITPIDNLLSLNPKLITISHKHITLLSRSLEDNSASIIESPGEFSLDYATVYGYECFHDKLDGIKRGYNNIYTIIFDNLKICHLGHLGHIPNNVILNELHDIDVLFIPIGGHLTLNGVDAALLTKFIKPKMVIPMYYRTPFSSSYLDSPKVFITSMKYVNNINSFSINTNDYSFDGSIKNQTLILKEYNLNSISKKIVK